MYDDEIDRSTEPEEETIDPTPAPGPGERDTPPIETDGPAETGD